MSMKSNNLASKLPQQLHVALDDKQLLPLFRVQGDFEHLCQLGFFLYNFISTLPDLGPRVGPKSCRLNK